MELVTKEDPLLPSLGESGGKPCSSRSTALTSAGAPATGFVAVASALNPERDEHTNNNDIKIVLINRIRTTLLYRDTAYALS